MDSPVVKKIFLALAVLLTLIVAKYALNMHNKTQPLERSSETALNTINQSLTTNEFSSYDNQYVSGAEVISVINTKATNDLVVRVSTKATSTYTEYTSPSYNITDIKNGKYIEPTASFLAIIGRTDNGTINSITFTQK
ncbi:hypothetical protein U732_49 [Clostridium argentinense CDC 2741]|uniref:Uncharacterized protein n=2 Tax=Clostridium argentinense TaxID=29341 RepID=A0A0C1QTV2_9CLOT|nr:hypothetical protein [Clostridium argentinense]ARC83096.1 hypothetical protein RSJ17_00135 [Clostridium argentinense]KIE44412.1 hypothetical protein U732_49 [Clostridium argentinense CDC 2741]NFF41352.1 hypothetical protein [Clostridium argentinense]NFP51753.1 hypothetical protein [Clostridium argentinense]NFP74277.1 hypothetical protein [Clostridium argentinense]